MPVRDLPGDPSLEHLRNQARSLQQRVRASDPEAVAAVREFYPRLAGAAAGSPGLARYFLQVARRFPEDQPLMLVAELDGQVIGAGFAFRRCSQPGEAVTLRDVGVLAPHDGIGLQRRLIRTPEQAARRLGAERVILGGPAGTERELYLSMGYRGRHDGGLITKALPRPRGRGPQPSRARPLP